MYLNRVQYEGTQTTPDTFSVTPVVNAEEAPNSDLFVAVIDEQGTDKYVSCLGSVTGSVFTINTVLESSENANAIPNFVGTVKVSSSVTQTDLFRMTTGKAVVALLGQSNISGFNTGADERDFAYSNNVQWDRSKDATIPVVEPLEHQFFNPARTPPCTSYATGFGNTLIDNGFKSVLNAPCGYDSSGYSTVNGWSPGDSIYNEAVQTTSDALNEAGSNNYLACILLRMGETDHTTGGYTSTQFRDATVDMITQFKAAVGANTGQDLSRVPVVIIGLNQDFLTANPTAVTGVEQGMSETPDYLAYSSYLAMPWSTSTGDNTHDSLTTVRRVGYQELLPKMREAEANRNPSQVAASLTADATVDITASAALVSTADLTASATVNVTASATLVGSIALTAAATVDVTAAASFPEGAPAPSFLVQKGVEQTEAPAGKLETWGSTVDTKQIENLTGSFVADLSAGVIDFPGTAIYNFNPGLGTPILNSAAGCTIIFDLNADVALANDNIISGTGIRLAASGDFAELQGTTTTWSGLTPSTRQWVAMTIDRTGDFMKVFIDGTEDAVVNGIAALESAGDATGDQQLGGTVGAYDGKMYNIYLSDQPLTAAQCQDAVDTYFVT